MSKFSFYCALIVLIVVPAYANPFTSLVNAIVPSKTSLEKSAEKTGEESISKIAIIKPLDGWGHHGHGHHGHHDHHGWGHHDDHHGCKVKEVTHHHHHHHKHAPVEAHHHHKHGHKHGHDHKHGEHPNNQLTATINLIII